jgi:hypothetical protein
MLNFGARCLIRLFSSASASTTESVTMTSRPGGLVEERVDPGAGAVGAQVAPHPVPERPGLADVQGLPGPVREQVDAGLFRQAGDLGLEITDRHAVHCAFARIPEPISIRLP